MVLWWYNTSFALYGLLVLWGYRYVFDCSCSVASEVCVDAILSMYTFDAFTQSFYVWYYYVSLVCVLLVIVIVVPNVVWFCIPPFLWSMKGTFIW